MSSVVSAQEHHILIHVCSICYGRRRIRRSVIRAMTSAVIFQPHASDSGEAKSDCAVFHVKAGAHSLYGARADFALSRVEEVLQKDFTGCAPVLSALTLVRRRIELLVALLDTRLGSAREREREREREQVALEQVVHTRPHLADALSTRTVSQSVSNRLKALARVR